MPFHSSVKRFDPLFQKSGSTTDRQAIHDSTRTCITNYNYVQFAYHTGWLFAYCSICCLITFISYYTIMHAMYSHTNYSHKTWFSSNCVINDFNDFNDWSNNLNLYPCFVAIVSMTVHSMHDCVIAYESDYVYTIWTKSLITQFALNYAL